MIKKTVFSNSKVSTGLAGLDVIDTDLSDSGTPWWWATNTSAGQSVASSQPGAAGNVPATGLSQASGPVSGGPMILIPRFAAGTARTTKVAPKDTFTSVVLASDTGQSASDFITSNGAVKFQGAVSDVGGPGIAWVRVFNGTTLLGNASVVNGTWTLSTTLAEGTFTALNVVATDTSGKSSTAFNSTAIVIDKKPPSLGIALQKLANDTGASANDLVTANGAVTLTGKVAGQSGAVQVFDGTALIGSALADIAGNWTFSTVLADGTHALHAAATDQAGNTATSAVQPAIVVDTSVPAVAFAFEDQVLGSNAVQLWGTLGGSAGTKVEIYSGTTDLGAATVTGSTWNFTTASLAPGSYSFSAVATTLAGKSATFGGIASLSVGSASGTLDPSKYSTVWKQDFTASSKIDPNIFPIVFGNPDEFSFGQDGLTLTSYKSEGFNNVGFLQPNWGANVSQGYGLYSVTASHPANQGAGIAILLWPSDNVWPGPEIDMVEDWSDPTSQTAYMTVHFKGPNGTDMGNSIRIPVDLTVPNTFALDWERGSLTYYINGKELFQITGSEVPLDAADGGVNAAFGAEIADIANSYQPSDRVSLTIANMSYCVVGPPPASISISNPGTVQETVAGAAVQVTETITGVSLHTSTVYAIVLDKNNSAYVDWQSVTLNGSGVGTFVANFFNTGDYLVVTTDPANQTINSASAPVTVLPPPVMAAAVVSSVQTLAAAFSGSPGTGPGDGYTDDLLLSQSLMGEVSNEPHGTNVLRWENHVLAGSPGGNPFDLPEFPGSSGFHSMPVVGATPAGHGGIDTLAASLTHN